MKDYYMENRYRFINCADRSMRRVDCKHFIDSNLFRQIANAKAEGDTATFMLATIADKLTDLTKEINELRYTNHVELQQLNEYLDRLGRDVRTFNQTIGGSHESD